MHPYSEEEFAQSLFHIGEHIFVPAWDTYILKRPILRDRKILGYDAVGLYPITILSSSTDIKAGLNFLRDTDLVSLVMVLDDFHRPPLNILSDHFYLCKKLKTHYIFDTRTEPIVYTKHHRYELKQAQKIVRTEIIDLSNYIDDWVSLYTSLCDRHHLTASHRFPIEHFKALSKMKNVVTLGAFIDDQLVSCHIWVEHKGRAHSHLAASNEQGYNSRAAYALNDLALHHFKNCLVINFGGGAGLNDEESGLSKFKKGFANQKADAIICGEIFDKGRYETLSILNGSFNQTNFFPAYRAPQPGDSK